jgi:hypothetical protein
VVSTVDTIVTVDTVVVTRVDTVVTVDTIVTVDTVYVATTLVASTSSLNLQVGQTATLTVTTQNPLGFQAPPSSVTWLSDAPSIASVSGAGLVRALSPGQATIYALASGLSVSVPTTVVASIINPPPPPPPPPQGFIFHFSSDWSTATGTSNAALLDASKNFPWDAAKGSILGGKVVTDTVNWRGALPAGTRALTVAHVADNDNPGVRLDQSLPGFTFGDRRGYRGYFKNIMPDDHEITSARHPWQDAAGGSNTNWEFNASVGEIGAYAPYFELPNSTCAGCGGTQWTRWTIGGGVQGSAGTLLPKDSVYRFEFLLTHHPTADSMDIEVRAYNPNGSIRVAADQWMRVADGSPSSRLVWYSIDQINGPNIRDMQIGVNGWGGGVASSPYVVWHWGGIAVCNDWCGGYNGR